MGQKLQNFFEIYFKELYFPKIQVTDVVEIIIIAFLVYQLMVWIKHTKAWMLLRGIIVLLVFIYSRLSSRCTQFCGLQRIPSASWQQQQLSCFSRSCEERWSVSGKKIFGLQ